MGTWHLQHRNSFGDPIRRAIWHLRNRYIGRYSFIGVVGFGLTMMLSIGLVLYGITHQPLTPPGPPAKVQRSVIYPVGYVPVPGPSQGPSTQGG